MSNMANIHATPFLRWAGSKRRLAPTLAEYWDHGYQRYIEPFMGSACLYFSIVPQTAVLSDINEHLVEAYIAVRDHPRAIANRLEQLPLGKDHYYQIRSQDCCNLDALDRVARFIYLNRFCFNGLFRTNLAGKFNVPYSPNKTGQLPTYKKLVEVSKVLRGAKLLSGDFSTVVNQECREGDFVYLDPPYAVSNRRIFRQYGPQTFGLEDIERLRKLLDEIDYRKATFVLSYAYCHEARDAFSKWGLRKVYTQRNISGFSKHRRKAAEVIISNTKLNFT